MLILIIGLIIVSLSYALASFIIGRLGFQPSPEESPANIVESCAGDCASGCAFGEKIDYNGVCKDEGYVCCVKEAEQSKYPDSNFCCVKTFADPGSKNKCLPLNDNKETGGRLDCLNFIGGGGNVGAGSCNLAQYNCE